MTEWQQKVIELAVAWRDARYEVEKAIIEKELWHAVDMLKKERRDAAGDEKTEWR